MTKYTQIFLKTIQEPLKYTNNLPKKNCNIVFLHFPESLLERLQSADLFDIVASIRTHQEVSVSTRQEILLHTFKILEVPKYFEI